MTSGACLVSLLASMLSPSPAELERRALRPTAEDLVGTKPPWVERAHFPGPRGGDAVQGGIERLLEDTQICLRGRSTQEHRRVVVAVASPAGLSEAANWELTWRPPFEDLAIHRILVRRGSELLSAFDASRIHVARRESDFEGRALRGEMSALITLDDVRVGDIVDLEWTVTGKLPVLEGRFAGIRPLKASAPVGRLRVRVNSPIDSPLTWLVQGVEPTEPAAQMSHGRIIGDWDFHDTPATEARSLPELIDAGSLELSEWTNWAEVAEWGVRNFAAVDQRGPGVRALAARLKRENPTDAARVAAAARFVEDEVRYLAESMGEGGLRPEPPESVLQTRSGDCKGKTTLLVAVLRAMDIDARPALVHTDRRAALLTALPSATAFDHVIAHVRLEGLSHWIDPTALLDRSPLAGDRQLRHGCALILEPGTQGLTSAGWTAPLPSGTRILARLSADSVGGRVRLDLRSVYFGNDADWARRQIAESSFTGLMRQRHVACTEYWSGVTVAAAPRLADDETVNQLSITESWFIDSFWHRDEDAKAWTGRLDVPHAVAAMRGSGLSEEARGALLPSASDAVTVTCMASLPQGATTASPDVSFDGRTVTLGRHVSAERDILRIDRSLELYEAGPGPFGDAERVREERQAMQGLAIDIVVPDTLGQRLVGTTTQEREARLLMLATALVVMVMRRAAT